MVGDYFSMYQQQYLQRNRSNQHTQQFAFNLSQRFGNQNLYQSHILGQNTNENGKGNHEHQNDSCCHHQRGWRFDQIAYQVIERAVSRNLTVGACYPEIVRKLLRPIQDRGEEVVVLEININRAINFPFYASHLVRVIAADPTPNIARIKLKARNANMEFEQVQIEAWKVENLLLEDNSVDYVIGIESFCKVEDPDRGLQEVYRVLKPGGKYYFVEHQLHPNNSLVRSAQYFFNWLWRTTNGCEINRDFAASLMASDFEKLRCAFADTNELHWLQPIIFGYAQKKKKKQDKTQKVDSKKEEQSQSKEFDKKEKKQKTQEKS